MSKNIGQTKYQIKGIKTLIIGSKNHKKFNPFPVITLQIKYKFTKGMSAYQPEYPAFLKTPHHPIIENKE